MTESFIDAYATLLTVITLGAFLLLAYGLVRARLAYPPKG